MKKELVFPVIVGFLCGLFFAGATLLMFNPNQGKPIQILPAPTEQPIKVYINGNILSPGIYEIKKDSRVDDLILLAGGFVEQPGDSINLASKLYDGQHLLIPYLWETDTNKTIEPFVNQDLININEATEEQLLALPGIGPTKAQAIIAFRNDNGYFSKIEDILMVPGIGEYTYNQIRNLITINQVITKRSE
ncbi:MAG: transporter [Chloroflexi bacterium HGW-Chloroflexi-10]|nr:MAG: transporter [Chloroflexi bacterium HGW-Chloroflexi-10]